MRLLNTMRAMIRDAAKIPQRIALGVALQAGHRTHHLFTDPADIDDEALCWRCGVTWPCHTLASLVGLMDATVRRNIAHEVMDVHTWGDGLAQPAEQCRACPPGTAWPCAHWDRAADVINENREVRS
ncbi:hypothetical protein FHX37_0477 [Haloactinospora alba]|uniref:Uncharacterized protein n=1 Tax=Haloactinospora alba TaxID=405555 RepID=A0A543NFI2_9ACTN|nr:hypothetical protein [Haloactinospora alba]TQN30595.1 hypothetical protein FHX37_0477 [Haloactinospora alba]